MNEATPLHDAVRRAYEKNNDRESISPAWLATEAMVMISFPRVLHEIGYLGCHLQMRQIARGFCRKHFDPEETVENDLFPGSLQQRYPCAERSGDVEPEYVVLESLSDVDVAYNVARLRKEADAKIAHADALEAWGLRKFGRAA